MHFNKLSSTITIEPMNKKILELNSTSEILEQIHKILVTELKNVLQRSRSMSKNVESDAKNSSTSFSMI
jgi:hypothetical protein